jgi:hypothetical protein
MEGVGANHHEGASRDCITACMANAVVCKVRLLGIGGCALEGHEEGCALVSGFLRDRLQAPGAETSLPSLAAVVVEAYLTLAEGVLRHHLCLQSVAHGGSTIDDDDTDDTDVDIMALPRGSAATSSAARPAASTASAVTFHKPKTQGLPRGLVPAAAPLVYAHAFAYQHRMRIALARISVLQDRILRAAHMDTGMPSAGGSGSSSAAPSSAAASATGAAFSISGETAFIRAMAHAVPQTLHPTMRSAFSAQSSAILSIPGPVSLADV